MVRPPRPLVVTSTPGAKRSTSATVAAPDASIAARSITVTAAVAESSGRSRTVAVA